MSSNAEWIWCTSETGNLCLINPDHVRVVEYACRPDSTPRLVLNLAGDPRWGVQETITLVGNQASRVWDELARRHPPPGRKVGRDDSTSKEAA